MHNRLVDQYVYHKVPRFDTLSEFRDEYPELATLSWAILSSTFTDVVDSVDGFFEGRTGLPEKWEQRDDIDYDGHFGMQLRSRGPQDLQLVLPSIGRIATNIRRLPDGFKPVHLLVTHIHGSWRAKLIAAAPGEDAPEPSLPDEPSERSGAGAEQEEDDDYEVAQQEGIEGNNERVLDRYVSRCGWEF